MQRLLLGIDLQNDFCHPDGALFVTGAEQDLANIIRLLENGGSAFTDILMSMDSHYPIHIAHSAYWSDNQGNHPPEFSTITYQEVIDQQWHPHFYPEASIHYLKALENADYQCTIWPPHCLIGTKGWAIPNELYQALSHWALMQGKNFELYNKGSNPFTEHYSILKAAVEFPEIPTTCFDQGLISRFQTFDEIVIAGEAMDFCVASTIKDMLGADPKLMLKLVILTDCMSNIIVDNPASAKIYQQAEALGAKLMTTAQYLSSLP